MCVCVGGSDLELPHVKHNFLSSLSLLPSFLLSFPRHFCALFFVFGPHTVILGAYSWLLTRITPGGALGCWESNLGCLLNYFSGSLLLFWGDGVGTPSNQGTFLALLSGITYGPTWADVCLFEP